MSTPKLSVVGEVLQAEFPELAHNQAAIKAVNRVAPAFIKKGRQLERSEIMEAVGVQAIEEISMLATVRADMDKSWQREEAKHGSHRFWQGVAIGGAVIGALVAVAAAWYTKQVIDPAFDAAARMQMQQSVVDTMQREAP